MQPRKLSVLRIDDRLNNNSKTDETKPQPDVPGGPLEIFKLGHFDCVSSWKNSMQLWAEYRGDKVPDLIVADVHFEDDKDAPLSKALNGIDNNLPTGLSHLKPFAALARASGVLLGVGIRTADAMLWERLIISGEPRQQCMGYLAAQEIGELAAILGDTEFVKESIKTEELKPLWDWLAKNTGHDFSQGLRVAVQNYRRRLLDLTDFKANPSIFIMPNDFVIALNWCAQMEKHPQPLNEQHDCGLTLTYRDGRRDCISLASIFADVEGITTRLLPAQCFRYSLAEPQSRRAREEICKLDRKRQPRIGLLLSKLGTLKSSYEQASEEATRFTLQPDHSQPSDYNLRIRVNHEDATLIRGLVMVFQLIWLEYQKYNSWKDLFENFRWLPRELRFSEERASSKGTLRQALLSLCHLICDLDTCKAKSFLREEVFENYDSNTDTWEDAWIVTVEADDIDKHWLKWHFDMLVEATILSTQPKDKYLLVRSCQSLDAPPVPSSLSNNISASWDPIFNKTWQAGLKQVLGFTRNDSAIGQTAYDAFVFGDEVDPNEKRKKGIEFMMQLMACRGPEWLVQLCQLYAVERLEWLNQSTWPKWLRPKH